MKTSISRNLLLLLWKCLFFPVSSATIDCPSDWVPSQASGTCIKAYDDKKTWSDARDACQQDGGDLIKIINAEMDSFVAG